MRSSVVLFGIALLAACGLPRPPDVAPGDGGSEDDGGGDDGGGGGGPELSCSDQSGSRIKLVMREHSDGSSERLRLHDSQLNVRCEYHVASDDKLRCMPIDNTWNIAELVYTSSACTTMALAMFSNQHKPTKPYITGDGDGFGGPLTGCAGKVRVFATASQITSQTTFYVRDANGACVVRETGPFSQVFFMPGPETAPTMFVEGTRTRIAAAGHRMSLEPIDGADGSRYCPELYSILRDTELGDIACGPQMAFDDTVRCMPTANNDLMSCFSNATCTAPQDVAMRPNCRASSPYAIRYVSTPCGYTAARVKAVGAQLSGIFAIDSMNICRTGPPTSSYYTVGADFVPDTMFAAVTSQEVAAGPRLHRHELVVGGARVRVPVYRDALLDTECTFDAYATGATPSCVPIGSDARPVASAWGQQVFSASGCAASTRVNHAVVYPPFSTCGPAPVPPKFAMAQNVTGYFEFYRVGAQQLGQFYSRYDDTQPCTALPSGSSVWAIGPRVTPDLVTGMEVVR